MDINHLIGSRKNRYFEYIINWKQELRMEVKRKSIFEIYRTELMGFGALLVVLCHWSYMLKLGNLPVTRIIEQLGRGGATVYLFMFLSGIGLYYSCDKTKRTVWGFYQRRFSRVLIPYLVIMGVWYAIEAVLLRESVLDFLYHWSTLSYWIEHKGAWFVCALIPIYLLYPYWHRFSEKGNQIRRHLCGLLVYFVFLLFLYNALPGVFNSQANVWMSVVFFELGASAGKSIRYEQSDCLWLISISIVIFLLQRIHVLEKWIPINQISYGFQGICLGLAYIGCILVGKKMKFNKLVNGVSCAFSVMGENSLEIYLMNVALMDLVRVFIQNEVVISAWWYLPIAVGSIVGGIFAGKGIHKGIGIISAQSKKRV